jgi:hypothetical protein
MVRLVRLLVVSFAAVVLGACSHDLESPQPALATIAPDLVCNGPSVSTSDGRSTVTVRGDRFTPMPSRTLEGPTKLLLPRITLTPAGAIPGGTAPTAPIEIDDDPDAPASSRVHWTSEQEMSFDILPADARPAGVFDLAITNPDGTSTARLARRLAILPPPIVAMIIPPAICDDQEDQTVVITGANFLAHGDQTPSVTVGAGALMHTYTSRVADADCQAVDGMFDEANVRLCTSLTITIPQGDFVVTTTTQLAVVVTNPAPADCASSSTPVTIDINPPPRVDSVMPASVCQGGSTITVNGANFQQGASVTLDCGAGAVVNASAVTVTPAGDQLTATFGGGAAPGTSCQVIVVNPDGCEDRPLPHKTVTVVTGPIVFFVDPEVVYNRINTRITVYATTIAQPLTASAVRIVPTGQMAPVTQLVFNPVAGHPNRLQAIVPVGQPTGVYDLLLSDNTGCGSILPEAITVTDTATVTLENVTPPFGYTDSDTSIQIARDTTAPAPANHPFVETPRVFLNPTSPQPTDVAVEVESVAFLDGDRVTGVVPAGTPVHGYDVVLVNPDGTVGVLSYSVMNGYASVAAPPPEILTATPSSIVNATGQRVILGGRNFAAGNVVTLSCRNPAGAVTAPPVVTGAPTCTGAGCTELITINGSGLVEGSVCIVRLTNPDQTFAEYSAIGVTGPSLNLQEPQAGPMLQTGRRGLVAAAGSSTASNRFVYAIGGDNGTVAGAMSSVEFAPVDPFGRVGAFTVQPYALNAPRTLAGATTIGRYIYVVGGNDGTGALATGERALILSPRETPRVTDLDAALQATGLEPGKYHYRISAVFAANDPDNPGGESLASDEFTVRVPAFPGSKVAITLIWRAPLDVFGAPLPNVVGYRVYRTVMPNDAPGTEVLLGANPITVAGTSFVDDGTTAPGSARPLPLGATGKWWPLPNLAAAREGVAVAWGYDPVGEGQLHLYALLGRTNPTTALRTYEFLTISGGQFSRQSVAASWSAGTNQSSTARWQLGAWMADSTVSNNITGQTRFIYVGGGQTAAGAGATTVEAAQVQIGGQLGAFNDAGVNDFGASQSGYGVCAANGQLFTFGGQNGAPSKKAKSAVIAANPPALAAGAWNDEGLNMIRGRYLHGSAVQSAFIFLLGGQTDEPSPASRTTELVIW